MFGWIKINNTDINYPVVQSNNNTYYLTHGFDKSYNSSGSIFADYKNNLNEFDKNTIIYGHNRRDGSMFSSLNYTLQENWYTQPENHYINFNTLQKTSIWKIFSIYMETSKNVFNPITFNSDVDFFSFVDSVKQKSIYDFNVNLNSQDKILTLYTCGNNTAYRIIVHSKLVYEH